MRLWLARILIAIVITWNLQAALAFFVSPKAFAPNFELSGAPGAAAVRRIAVLFFMWNVPYLVAAWHPQRHRVALLEALVMQLIGVIGETIILLTIITPGHSLLPTSILRFIIFDGSGLLALALAFWLSRTQPGTGRLPQVV